MGKKSRVLPTWPQHSTGRLSVEHLDGPALRIASEYPTMLENFPLTVGYQGAAYNRESLAGPQSVLYRRTDRPRVKPVPVN